MEYTMSSLLYRLLKNSNLVFLTAFLLGLFLGGYASSLKGYILPALVFIMTLSTTQITLSELTHIKNYFRDILFVFVINYIFLSGRVTLYLFIEGRNDGLSGWLGKPLSAGFDRGSLRFFPILRGWKDGSPQARLCFNSVDFHPLHRIKTAVEMEGFPPDEGEYEYFYKLSLFHCHLHRHRNEPFNVPLSC